MLKIGNIELRDKALLLAPMEDITDASFRYICRSYGADLVYTEFVPSEGLIRNISSSMKKMRIGEQERPAGIQLYGHIVDSMVESAKIAATLNPNLIDINCGCPVRKIATRGAGAGLLQNIPLMIEMVTKIVKAVDVPVTVKTRLGWDDQSKIIVDVAERLQDTGIKALTIHGRTRAQLYTGQADWTLIGAVKNNPRMHIPIIGNGDIISAETASDAFNKFGVDGIMIGRATIGRPWIFKEIRHYLDTGELLPDMGVRERADLAKMQMQKSIEYKGMPRGLYEMRRHLCNYFKGLPHFKDYKLRLVTSMEISEIEATLDEIVERYGGNTEC